MDAARAPSTPWPFPMADRPKARSERCLFQGYRPRRRETAARRRNDGRRREVPRVATKKSKGRPRPSLSAGFRYLVQHPRLGHLILLTGITAFCAWPFLTLLPALAKQTLAKDANGYSLMVSGTGFGALAAAWAIATFGTMERRRKLIGLGIVIIAGALLGLSFAQDLVLAIACSSLAGFGLILFFATGQSVVQLSTEEHNRGQLMGIWAMMLSGAVPLGSLIVGPAADEWGTPVVIFAEGLGCAGAALYLFVYLWIRARSTRSQVR